MSLTIAPKQAAESALPLQQDLTRNLKKLASGKRIEAAADAAAGLAVSQRLDAHAAALNRGVQNMNDGISVVRVAEGGLSGIAGNLTRMRELAVAYRNGTVGESEREAIQDEFDALAEGVSDVAETTSFSGRQLLDGEASGEGAMRLEDGASGAEDVEISIESQTVDSLGLEGLDLSDPDALETIDAAQEQVSSARAQLGSLENRIHSQTENLRVQAANTAESSSRMADLDYAQATAQQTRNQILQQFQVALRGQANASAGVALQLLS